MINTGGGMVKKYIVILSALLVIILFTSTSTASFSSSKDRILERLQENSVFKKISENIFQIEYNDEDDIDEELDQDELIEDVRLPKIWNMIGEKTPDDGDEEVVDNNYIENNSTMDSNIYKATDINNDFIIDENGEVGNNSEIIIEKDGEVGRTLERVIEIITENNEKLGAILEKIVEHTYAPGTTESTDSSENIVSNVVVEVGSVGISENNKAEVVVLTTDE